MAIYTYRVDLCHRNAQNEEVRSHSFYSDALTVTLPGTVTLTIKTCITRRTDSYFLIFRNEDIGTNWFLVNSRDPSSADFRLNDLSQAEVTFTDSFAIDDTELIALEAHPGNGITYLDQFASRACEIIAAGADRLWVAGGELDPGVLMPSRLFEVGEAPAFNDFIQLRTDRGAEPITGIGFVGELIVPFHRNAIYLVDGEGPDNSANGAWPPARLAYSDLGAQGPESIAVIARGLIFQSPAGIRLISANGSLIATNGQIENIGGPVDAVAEDMEIAGVVVFPVEQEVRFYARSGSTLVFNYEFDSWSTWRLACAGAVRNFATGLGILAMGDGRVWEETEGETLDDGATFRHRIRFAWVRANGIMDFQAVRRIGGLGECDPEEAHRVRVEVFYNEREHAGEFFEWDYPEDSSPASWATDEFGDLTFGSGTFGDMDADQAHHQSRDSVWSWKRRVARRKCSVISVAIDDNYTNGAGFILTALALELGIKPGMDRVPNRGGTYTNTQGSGTSRTGRE